MTIKQQYAANLVGHWDFRRGMYQDVDGDYPTTPQGTAYSQMTEKGHGYRLLGDTNDYFQVANGDAGPLLLSNDLVFVSVFYLPYDVTSNSYLMGAAGTSENEEDNILYSVRINSGGNNLTALHEYGAGTNVAANSTITVSPGINFLAVSRDTNNKEYTFCLNGECEVVSYSDNPTGGGGATFEIGAVQGIGSIDAVILETMVFNTSLGQQYLTQMYSDWQKEAWLTSIPKQTILPKGSIMDGICDPIYELDMTIEGDSVANLRPGAAVNDPTVEGGVINYEGAMGAGAYFPGGTDERLDGGLTDLIHELTNASFIFMLEPSSFNNYEGWLTQGTSTTNRTRIGVGGPGAGTNKDILINFADNAGVAPSAYTTSVPLAAGAPTMVRIEFDGTGATDADKIKCYVNEEEQTLTFAGDQPTQLSSVSANLYIGDDPGAASREYHGVMNHLVICDDNLTEAQGAEVYERFAKKVNLNALQDDAVETIASQSGGFLSNSGFEIVSGSWNVEPGDGKAAMCVTAGAIAIPSKQAYGTWEFDVYKDADANTLDVQFMSTEAQPITSSTNSGYSMRLSSTERFSLYEFSGGASSSDLMYTATGAVTLQNLYRIRITRTPAGWFTVYVKDVTGNGAWQELDVTGGSGTNPKQNTNQTSSSYLVIDADAGDAVKNFVFYPLPIDPTA